MYKLSGRSLNKLEGVHPTMVDTVKRAIELSKVDFGVIYGVRSLAEQKRLYEAKRSQTMKSKHLVQEDGYSHAVDLMDYDGIGNQGRFPPEPTSPYAKEIRKRIKEEKQKTR